MKMTVKTNSGSVYTFTQENGRTFFRNGLLGGEVVRITTITIGEEIHMDFHKERLLGGFEDCTMFLNSTPVTDISVTL